LGKRLSKLPTVVDFMEEKEDGTLIEKHTSVADAINAVVISDEVTRARTRNSFGPQNPFCR
jgi:hypothetical protein